MKKSSRWSFKKLFIKDVSIQKNTYKHFFAFDIGFKNGEKNKFNSDTYT
jgi:hypothetical protein